MPSTRITLANNAQQTARSVVLVDVTSEDALAAILTAAKRKLRLKRPSRIFLPSGTELSTHEDILHHVLNDTLLLVSCGEDFVGVARTPSPTPSRTHIVASESYIDPEAKRQLATAAALPGAVYVAGMPDLHPGNRFPIGAAVFAHDTVHPPLVGGDIGCGMALFRTALPSTSDPRRLAERLRGLEGGWPGDVPGWLAARGVAPTEFDARSLGTVGGGNHFAELQAVARVADADALARLGLREDRLALLVHSGSRGLGQAVLRAQEPTLEVGSDACTAYLAAHDHACAWARANRALIAHRIFERLSTSTSATDDLLLDLCHNSVVPHTLTSAEAADLDVPEDRRDVWIHRKGAAPSADATQPLIVPGSRGAHTYVLLPTGAQHHNALSVAHGAGRAQSRAVAGQRPPEKDKLAEKLRRLAENGLGGVVICEDEDLVFEEAPAAYKDVEAVVNDLVEAGLVKVVAVMRPVVTYKVRRE